MTLRMILLHPQSRTSKNMHRLWFRLDGFVAKEIKPHLHDTTCCQTGLTTGLTNSGCLFNTVVKSVVQPVWQQLYRVNKHPTGCQTVVSCKRGITVPSKKLEIQRHGDTYPTSFKITQ